MLDLLLLLDLVWFFRAVFGLPKQLLNFMVYVWSGFWGSKNLSVFLHASQYLISDGFDSSPESLFTLGESQIDIHSFTKIIIKFQKMFLLARQAFYEFPSLLGFLLDIWPLVLQVRMINWLVWGSNCWFWPIVKFFRFNGLIFPFTQTTGLINLGINIDFLIFALFDWNSSQIFDNFFEILVLILIICSRWPNLQLILIFANSWGIVP